MSMKRTALKLAPVLIGMPEDAAVDLALQSGCSCRFIVRDGYQCGVNTDVETDSVCFFADHGCIEDVVIGSKDIYQHPRYLGARPRGSERRN